MAFLSSSFLGYVGIFKQRTGSKPDGCATFFRENRFICCQSLAIEYRIPGHALMNRDNIGLIVALDPKERGQQSNKPTIFIANTHLLFNKKRGDLKLLQLAKLLADIEDMAKVVRHLPEKATTDDMYNPVIICGDFNSTPTSPLYEFITKGKLKYEGLCPVHISGQMSPLRRVQSDTCLQRRLIPEEMNLSNLCQKRLTNHTQVEHCASMPGFDDDNIDCFVVAETIEGRTVIMEEPGVLKHLIRLQSAYKHRLSNGKPEVSSSQGTVDYILYSQGMQRSIAEQMCSEGDIFMKVPRKQLYLTGILSLLSSDDLDAMNGIPNPVLSSDHLPLLASFRLLE